MEKESITSEVGGTPSDAVPSDRRHRWWTSWQLWLSGLLLALGAISGVAGIPIYRRSQAIAYLRDHDVAVWWSLDDEWVTERFGEWAKPFRSVQSIKCIELPTRDIWPYILRFREVESASLPIGAFTWETFEQLQALPNLTQLEFHVHTSQLHGTGLSGASMPWEFVNDEELYQAVVKEWKTTFMYGM